MSEASLTALIVAVNGLADALRLLRIDMAEARRAPWGYDHAGRPMRHAPSGNCYCRTPGDGFDRCGPTAERAGVNP